MVSCSGCWFRRAAGGPGAAFPSTLLRLPAALYGACPALRAVLALGCSTKARNKKLRLLFVPSPSGGSGSQELDGRTLPGCSAPSALRLPASVSTSASRVHALSALRVPSPSPRPRQSGACALCLAATLQADVDHPEFQEVFG